MTVIHSVCGFMDIIIFYRHWHPIPSNGHNCTDYSAHMHTPDGTYLASEFNYSLPRHQKGYDPIGLKHQSSDKTSQRDHPFATNARPKHENDKGYYSDHTYESPRRGLGQMANSGSVGYRHVHVNADENDAGVESRQNIGSFSNGDPRVTQIRGTLTFPRPDSQSSNNVNRGTLQHNPAI